MTFRKIILSIAAPLLLAIAPFATAQANPVPLINNPLVPSSLAPHGGQFSLTVNGTGFVPGSLVNWNGVALATNFVNGSQLTATVPSANIAAAGTASVTVLNPAPGGGVSNLDYFVIRRPFPAISFSGSGLATGAGYPDWVTTIDLNGDGKLDLVVTEGPSDVSVFLGNGNGTFQPAVNYAAGGPPNEAIAADFSGDEILDLGVVTINGVSILLGNGDGTFQIPQTIALNGGGEFLVQGDLNGDGNLDLAVSLGSGQVAILLGNGDGTFENPAYLDVSSGLVSGIAVADFNGDGQLDLAIASRYDNAVTVLAGNGDGTFQPGVEYSTAPGPVTLAVADLNEDAIPDLAVTSIGSLPTAISVLLGNGDGTFRGHVDYPTSGDAIGIVEADLNGDGKLDLATPDFKTGVNTFLGKGDGTFYHQGLFTGGTNPYGLATGDFNGDGLLDLASVNENTLTPTIFLLPQVTSILSNSVLNFGSVQAGETKTIQVFLSNIADTALSITRINVGKTVQFSESNNCGNSLASGATCTISVVFKPTGSGFLGAVLRVGDSAASQPQTVMLSGKGI